MSQPNYYMHPNRQYRDNPLIEALGQPLTMQQFYALSELPFINNVDLTGVDASLHGYYIRTQIDQLNDVYAVQDEAYRLYDVMRRMIEAGYDKRNPLRTDIRRILTAIDRDKTNPNQVAYLSSLELYSVLQSYLLIGLSGRGKSFMVRRILKLFDQVIEHFNYTDHKGREHTLDQSQVTYLYVEIHERRGQKALLLNMLEALDEVTGQAYAYEHRNRSVNELITIVRKLLIGHSVGLVVVDEAQNLAKSSRNEVLSINEKTSIKFVEELFNRVGVPIMLVGTFATLALFERETTIGRRVTKNGSMLLASCDSNSSFWNRFIRLLCQTQLLKNQSTSVDILCRHIHYLSAGIPAIASSLVRATLAYLTFLAPQDQDLSIAALDLVFNREFRVLTPALTALRKGDYHKFEDFEPMLMLESVASHSDVMTQIAPPPAMNLIQGEVELSDKPVSSQIEVQKRKKLDQLSPSVLLGQLGYNLDKAQPK